MPLLSEIIMSICMVTSDPTCIERLHVCVRDTFEINFFDTLSKDQEATLPYMVQYCEIERKLSEE